MYCIYRIRNKVNGKTYIGQHKYKKLNDSYMGSGVLLAKAKRKYGIENFEKEILEKGIETVELANDFEQMYILFERAKGKAEYNIANGGLGGYFPKEIWDKISKSRKAHNARLTPEERKKIYGREFTDEVRRKMSESHKGQRWTEEQRQKISEALKGENNPNFGKPAWNRGKPRPEETKRKISETHKGMVHSEEAKRKMSEAKKGNTNRLGKCHFEETKRKISEANKGKHWYNNGVTSVTAFECPEGFVKGILCAI